MAAQLPIPRALPWLVVGAVVAMSAAAPMIVAAGAIGMTSLQIAFWRMLLAVGVHLPLRRRLTRVAGRRGRTGTVATDLGGTDFPEVAETLPVVPSARSLLWPTIGAGVILGIHMGCFVGSLGLTSVASASTLVATVPLFTGLGAHLLTRDKVRPLFWVSLAVAIVGIAVMTRGDWSGGSAPAIGNMLALGAAATGAAYYLLGRRARAGFPLGEYVLVLYGLATLTLAVLVAVGGDGFALPPARGLVLCLAMALVPTLLGHSIMNWALQHANPAVLSLLGLLEPALALFFCWVFLGQTATAIQLVGSAITLSGVALLFVADLRRRSIQRRVA